MSRVVVDDTGARLTVPEDPGRVVSLVPSLTESVAVTAPGLVVGATRYCDHPEDLDVVRVGGTKNPDVEAVIGLAPDLVLAAAEENREPDLERLRAAGLAVYVTDIRTVGGALASLARMLDACGLARPAWLDDAERAWAGPPPADAGGRFRAVILVWRRPWMALGRDTFAGDVLARLGVDNVLADDAERYPRIRPDDLPAHHLVVLPSEPYAFTATDGPEAFPGRQVVLVSGRHLTWYGPSLAEAPAVLRAALAAPIAR